jgi:hypothetical protein
MLGRLSPHGLALLARASREISLRRRCSAAWHAHGGVLTDSPTMADRQ